MASNKIYLLNDNVRIFDRSSEEIRLRTGIWNYYEAIIDLGDQSERMKNCVSEFIDILRSDGEADVEALGSKHQLSPAEVSAFIGVCESMKVTGLLIDKTQKELSYKITSILLGEQVEGLRARIGSGLGVLFFSDNKYAKEAAQVLARQIKLPIDIMTNKVFVAIKNSDLTTNTNTIEITKRIEKFERQFQQYSCIIGCLQYPYVSFLRNINRVLIKAEKPLSLGLLDGPFMSMLSISPTETGCLECYENRLLSRMEDHIVYHQFIASEKKNTTGLLSKSSGFSPFMHMMVSILVSEAFLLSTINKSKFMGRAISIYIPLFEIQVQDLLRLPFCPACGFIAKSQMNEMYVSSKKLIDNMLKKIEVTKNGE